MTNESILVTAPYYLYRVEVKQNESIVSLYMSMSLFLIIPTSLLLSNYLSNKMKDRKIIILLVVFCVMLMFVLSRLENSVFFMFLSGFIIVISSLLENLASQMFAKIIPSNYEICKMDAFIIINYITTFARLIGCLSLFVFPGLNEIELINIIFTISFGFYCFILFLSIVFYNDLRVKAIARLMRNKSMRKHKSGEF
jgi:hypothetical protein